jgi:sigma-B regulation protein RsbQ
MQVPSASDPAQAALVRRHHLTFLGAQGPPMLFCHGLGMDQTLWRALAPGFADRHRVILMDLVGSGRSDLTAYRLGQYASIQGHIDDLATLVRTLDLRGLVYVGHSVGAMVGLAAALDMPERFAALVMLGASPRYLEDGDYHGGFQPRDVAELLEGFDANREAWTGQMAAAANPDRPELAEEVRTRFLDADPSILRQFVQATFAVDFRRDLGWCRTPALLLQSREDPIVPVAVSEYLARALPGARLRYLATSGHFASLSAPGEVAAAMDEFLAGLG